MVKSQRQKDREEAIRQRAEIVKYLREQREQEEQKDFKQKVKNTVDMLLSEEQTKGESRTMEEIKVNDNVNHPKHYEGHTSIECIDAMILTFGAKRTAEYCVQNAYKYVWRHKYKNQLEDLKKAEWYLNKFDELMTWCETKFSADGTIETRYIEMCRLLRGMIKTEKETYEVNK